MIFLWFGGCRRAAGNEETYKVLHFVPVSIIVLTNLQKSAQAKTPDKQKAKNAHGQCLDSPNTIPKLK